jgi:MFS family permease
MSKWLLRGLVFAALMVIVRLLQGAMINAWETKAGLISIVLIVLFAVAVFVWGLIDGRADARANPDPDRRGDLAMTWLLAGLFAGVVSGVVAWFISLFYKGLYVEALLNEVTTFAAFTALLVFLFAIAGVSLGRWAVDRNLEKQPRKHHGLAEADADQDRADTDVFAAVRHPGADTTETAPTEAASTEARRGDQS